MPFFILNNMFLLLIITAIILLIIFYVRFIFEKPLWGYGLLFLWIPLMDSAPKQIGFYEIVFLVLSSCSFLVFLMRRFIYYQQKHTSSPLDYPIFFIIIAMLLSFFPAIMNNATPYNWFRQIAPFLGLIFYFFLKNETTNIKHIELLTIFILISTIIVSIITFYSVIENMISINNFINVRKKLATLRSVCFTSTNYGVTGLLMGYLVSNKDKKTCAAIILLLVCLFSQLLTITRGYIINFGLLCLAFLGVNLNFNTGHNKKNKLLILVALISILTLLAIFIDSNIKNRDSIFVSYLTRIAKSNLAIEDRLIEIQSSIKILKENPIFGQGLGTTMKAEKPEGLWEHHFSNNIFAYFAFTMGTIGLLLIVWLIFSVYWICSKILQITFDDKISPYFWAYLFAICSMFLVAQFQASYRHFNYILFVSLNLAILNRLYIFSLGLKKGDNHQIIG